MKRKGHPQYGVYANHGPDGPPPHVGPHGMSTPHHPQQGYPPPQNHQGRCRQKPKYFILKGYSCAGWPPQHQSHGPAPQQGHLPPQNASPGHSQVSVAPKCSSGVFNRDICSLLKDTRRILKAPLLLSTRSIREDLLLMACLLNIRQAMECLLKVLIKGTRGLHLPTDK